MKILKSLIDLLRPYWRSLLFVFVMLMLTNAAALAMPWGLKIVIDDVVPNRDSTLLTYVTLFLVAAFLIKFFVGYFSETRMALVGERIISDLRCRLFSKIQQLSVSYVEEKSVGALVSRVIGDVDSIRDFIFGGAVDFVYSFFSFLCIAILLFCLDSPLALVAFLYVPFCILLYLKRSPALKDLNILLREKYEGLTAFLHDTLSGIRVVAGYGCEDREILKFSGHQESVFLSYMETHKLGFLLWLGSEFLSGLATVAIIFFGVKRVLAGAITAGELVAFYSYLGMLLAPVIRMALVNNYFQEASASMERVDELLELMPSVNSNAGGRVFDRIADSIVFDKVSFSYGNIEDATISDVSFALEKGKSYAIVGKSGSGKTSLLNLLLRFYDPHAGDIKIDGVPLQEFDPLSYRSRIAIVPQDDYLFSGSIKENLLFAKPEANEDELRSAIESAHAHEFIDKLPDGCDTIIGGRGYGLSVGQRQRLSIARAILRDPDLLVLDEALSNIDTHTERKIVDGALKNLMRGRTTVIVSHRFSTISGVDKIFVIENGTLVQEGSHDILLQSNGIYKELWKKQHAGIAS